jgi:cysteinyl-tRNA synthetase
MSRTWALNQVLKQQLEELKEAAMRKTNYDVLIIDAFHNSVQLNKTDISLLKTKANGGKRLVVAYMSIGEAERYRWYWGATWKVGSPSFIHSVNPDWAGNYKVKYWSADWKKIIFGNDSPYTKKLLNSGFDGAYLDIIDAFEFFENL